VTDDQSIGGVKTFASGRFVCRDLAARPRPASCTWGRWIAMCTCRQLRTRWSSDSAMARVASRPSTLAAPSGPRRTSTRQERPTPVTRTPSQTSAASSPHWTARRAWVAQPSPGRSLWPMARRCG
jgi:hypothetical protein